MIEKGRDPHDKTKHAQIRRPHSNRKPLKRNAWGRLLQP